MRVIRGQTIVEEEIVHLDDETSPPSTGLVSVPLARYLRERDELRARGSYAVRLRGEDDLGAVVDDLSTLDVIVLEFPVFTDGRCYTHARLLRERYGWRGELRATGDVLRDQLFFMARCGIDVFEVRADKNIEDALEALKDFSVTYQPASDGRPPIYGASQSAA